MNSMLSKSTLRDFLSGPLNQLMINVLGEQGDDWLTELNKFNRREKCWEGVLKFKGAVSVPGGLGTINASSYFKPGGDIERIDENFTKYFLSGEQKIESPSSEHVLFYSDVTHMTTYQNVISAIGGKKDPESKLWDLIFIMNLLNKFSKMKKPFQSCTFFIEDKYDVLRAVCLGRGTHSGKFHISVDPIVDVGTPQIHASRFFYPAPPPNISL